MHTRKWHSIHMFIHDFQSHDVFIKTYLTPFIEKSGEITSHFFIRYWQGGPHIRFRFQCANPERVHEKIEYLLNKFRAKYHPRVQLTPEMFYKHHKFDGSIPAKEELYWMADLSAHFIPYEPEIERYGDGTLLELNEALFEKSSILAEQVLVDIPENHLMMKLLISYNLFQIVDDYLETINYERIGSLYERFWEFQKNSEVNYHKIESLLANSQEKFMTHDSYRQLLEVGCREAKPLVDDLKNHTNKLFFRYMMMSQLHMFNNRMGLPPEFECIIGKKVGKEQVNEMVV